MMAIAGCVKKARFCGISAVEVVAVLLQLRQLLWLRALAGADANAEVAIVAADGSG